MQIKFVKKCRKTLSYSIFLRIDIYYMLKADKFIHIRLNFKALAYFMFFLIFVR